jgi:hypothetical protein
MIEGKEKLPETKCHKIFYWTTLIINILAGPLKALAIILFLLQNWRAPPSHFWISSVPYIFNVIGVCQIISGAILVHSVFKIHNFFKDRNDIK